MKHDWVAIATYSLSAEQAAEATNPDSRGVKLGPHNVRHVNVGCYACEEAYEDACNEPCPGKPVVRLGPGGVRMMPS